MVKIILSAFLLGCLINIPLFACTDFRIKAEDGSVLIARTNEFSVPANSNIVFEPAGKTFTSKTPDGKNGLGWKSRYGFIALNGMGLTENFIDGLNEAGLSVGMLLFTESKYEAIDKDNEGMSLSNLDLCSWILGNFGTVDELKKELPNVRVWLENVPEIGEPLPLHVAVHDAAGNSIVIEFINGEKKVYDNPIGVMTNMPEFSWQVTNLRTFANANPFNPDAKSFSGVTTAPFGQGNGWLGLPGDWTPPSRFVRVAYALNSASSVKDVGEALSLAGHIINIVDIPFGVIRDKGKGGPVLSEYTQWTVFKDLKNKIMYFKTYDNANLRFVDLNKLLSYKDGALRMISMTLGSGPEEVTGKLIY